MLNVKLKAAMGFVYYHIDTIVLINLIRNVHLQYKDICCLALSITSIKVPPLKSQCFAALYRQSK